MRIRPSLRRRAFTLLEVLVALVLLSVGILGVSTSAALVSRMIGDGARLTLAATVATARLEQLRAIPCASATAGAAVTRGVEERWSVAPMGGASLSALEVQLSVTYRLRTQISDGPTRTQRFRGAIHCSDA